MMKIHIKNGHALCSLVTEGLRRNRRIVEEAIATIEIIMGMVPGRAYRAERATRAAIERRIHRGDDGTGVSGQKLK